MSNPSSIDGPVTFKRLIEAMPDEAFALFTEPERLRRWQAVSAGLDLRVGGEYRLTVTPGHVANGRFTEVEPGERVVYTWGWVGSDDPSPGSSTIVVEFEPAGDRTLVRLTHSGLSAAQVPGHTEGWTHFLERLELAASAGDAGLDPWAAGGGDLDEPSAAEASWVLCGHALLALGPDTEQRPTQCSEFAVSDLVEHLMGSLRALGSIAGADIAEDIYATSIEDRVAQAAEAALAAWRDRGLHGEVPFGVGSAPAVLPAGILSLEFFVHAWDFAQATDQPFVAPDALTAYVTVLAERTIQPDNRGEDRGFAAAGTPIHDDAVSRLIAFTGRTA